MWRGAVYFDTEQNLALLAPPSRLLNTASTDTYILEGEAKAGFTVFGIKFDVTGSAGIGVSARAKVGVTTQNAEAKLKLGPFGLGLSIGW